MKAHQIRELSDEELRQKNEELIEQLFKLRFQVAIGQAENHQKLKLVRRDLARIETIKKERQLKNGSKSDESKEEDKKTSKGKK